MALECWVIIIILGIAAYMFKRSRRREWVGCVFPLMLVPFVNILYSPIGRRLMVTRPHQAPIIRTLVYIAALAAASIWIVLWARKHLPYRKSRYIYCLLAIGFTLILIIVFLKNLVIMPSIRFVFMNAFSLIYSHIHGIIN